MTRTLRRLPLVLAALALGLVLLTAGCGGPKPPPIVEHSNPLPNDFAAALERFRPEGTPGWSFTQTTTSGDKRLVEHYDASQLEFKRWSLVNKDGHGPTEDDLKEYKDGIEKRSIAGTPPNVKDQILRNTWEKTPGTDANHVAYRFRLKPGGEEDKSAAFMAVTFFMHTPTQTIDRVELGSLSSFVPMFGVQIYEAKTVIRYEVPQGDRPVLLQDIQVSVKGRAMGFKSLDKDMHVVYSDYALPQAAAKP